MIVKRSHLQLCAIAAGTFAVVALFAYLILSSYREKLHDTATTTRNYAAIIEARFDAALRRAGAHLQVMATELPLDALDKQAVPRFSEALDAGLAVRRQNFPELSALRVFDSAGDLIYTSESATTPRVNEADRDYFRAARDGARASLVYSEVAIGRVTGRPALTIAKALRDSQGKFRGLVSASVEVEYFQKLFQSLDIGEQGLITIFRSDSFSPVLRRPAIAGGKSVPLSPGMPTREVITAGKKQGTFEIVSATDGVKRIYSIAVLEGYPFFVGVGISTRDALAGWAVRSLLVGLFGLLPLGLILATLYRLWHTSAARDRLATIVDNSNYAILGRDLKGKITSWSAGAQRMLGYSAAEVIGKPADFTVPPHRASYMQQNTQRLLNGEHVIERQTDRMTKDGRPIQVFTSHAPIHDSAGKVIGTSIILQDITALKVAEAAIHDSEMRFRATFDQVAVGIAHFDLNDRYIRNNRCYSEITGYAPEELLGTPPRMLNHPDDRDIGHAERARLMAGAIDYFSNEKRYTRKDGTVIWVTRTESLARDDTGKPLYTIRVIEDITERKHIQNSLQLTQFSIDRAVNPVFWIKPNAEIIYVNDAACRVLGYAREEMVGKTVSDIDPHFPPHAWPAHWEELKRQKSLTFESDHYTANGGLIHTEVTANYIQFQGQEYNCAFMRDITERKLAGTTRALLATIVENSTDAIISRTLDGTILSWNAAAEKMFGYATAEAIGQRISFIMPSAMEHIVRDHSALLSAGKPIPLEEVIRLAKDGTAVPVIRSISPIRDESQTVIGAAIVMHDISALRLAEQARTVLAAQLRESQKMQAIGTLAGGIAHDFNNIIAAILGNVDLARQDTANNPQARESLAQIDKAASRARDLVQQILAFSRRQPTHLKPESLPGVVEETARLLRATLPARLTLNVYCDPDAPLVLADATQIQQVIINLATNAYQAMPEGTGHIDIRLDTVLLDAGLAQNIPALLELHQKHPGRTVRIAVSDTGLGMDAATRERVFEPFFTTKPVGEGTGLGLSVAHGIIQEHGGTITVDSEPGMGSTFTLYLPADTVLADTVTPEADTTAMPAPAVSGGVCVMYIDDDEDLSYLVKRLLERRGYRVASYTHAQDALAALRADPAAFELVLTDYNMPGMSGLDVARAVQGIRAGLPVAVASGFIDEKLQSQAAAVGVQTLIFKADSVEMFCDTVQRLVDNRGKVVDSVGKEQ